ncbi:MAG: hypothetical protein IJI65_09075 [Lachnospiraceae bacterium]|nr:hypothetical protein [Lachnospiraceae bacterium]
MKKIKRIVHINGVPVNAEKELIENENVSLAIYAGSTGLCGGNRKKGGRTYISMENKGATDMIVSLVTGKDGNGTGFEIAASGDAELISLAYAFANISATLLNSITEEEE